MIDINIQKAAVYDDIFGNSGVITRITKLIDNIDNERKLEYLEKMLNLLDDLHHIRLKLEQALYNWR